MIALNIKLAWIPRDFLNSRTGIPYSRLISLALPDVTFFLIFLLSEKYFQKNHKFSLKNHFFWKRDEFEGGLLGPPGRDYAHSKENFFLYQNRLRWQPGISGISQKMYENGGHLVIFLYFLELFSNFFLEKYPNQFKF